MQQHGGQKQYGQMNGQQQQMYGQQQQGGGFPQQHFGVVPQQMQMGGGGGNYSALAGPNLYVKQTRRGCIQELIGCEAKSEFLISTLENKDNAFMYALEDTTCLNRFICNNFRKWTMNVTQGNQAGGALVASYDRPLRCPMGGCKPCCYQEVYLGSEAVPQGSVVETCYFCVPEFNVVRPDGVIEYRIAPPTCLGGMCINICAEGLCNCRFPFYVFNPSGGTTVEEKVGNITKIWAGFKSELFTDAQKYEINFPSDASPDARARLLGGLFLINQLFYEGAEN